LKLPLYAYIKPQLDTFVDVSKDTYHNIPMPITWGL